jgi:cysteine synthase
MAILNSITETVGSTPLLRLNRSLPDGLKAEILVKLEYFNPTSSIKDRPALEMVKTALEDGSLKPGGMILEATSGNTGLGLAMAAAAFGCKLVVTMPESMSLERRALLKHLGAELVLTPAEQGMTGAVNEAERLAKENPGSFVARQFDNPANPLSHSRTTAREIIADTDSKLDVFVVGIGTGGTVTGAGRVLKQEVPDVYIVGVEPDTSAVLSGEASGKHGIQGIGAGFIPGVLETSLLDEVIRITDTEAIEMSRRVAAKDGVLCGISAGANIAAACKLAARSEFAGKRIVTVIPDTGERYLSTALFEK